MKLNGRFIKIITSLLLAWLLVHLIIASSPHLGFASLALAQNSVTPTEAMRVANQDYEAGQYPEAVAIYETIIASGLHHSSIYYNLGNAYYKQGDIGRAILNYRRAARLEPRDADIAANLDLARTQTVDKLETPAEEGLPNLVKFTEAWLTLNEAMILALILWLLIGFLAVLALLKPSLRRWCGVGLGILGVFLIIGLISIANRFSEEKNYSPGVIVAQTVDITSGPGTSKQYLVEFTLHAGAEVSLIESRPGWERLALPGDLQGWAPAETVGRVNN
jgi:tetratricopeptide (TPR) repeat protein